jgi:hypothetical protein
MAKSCSECAFFVEIAGACAAPQLVELARLVHGEARNGTVAPALLLRLNQSVCGTPGFWHVPKPEPVPEAKEFPASA